MLSIRKPFPTKEAALFGSLTLLIGYFGMFSLMMALFTSEGQTDKPNTVMKRDTSHDVAQPSNEPNAIQGANSQGENGNNAGTNNLSSNSSASQSVVPTRSPVIQQAAGVAPQPVTSAAPAAPAPTTTVPTGGMGGGGDTTTSPLLPAMPAPTPAIPPVPNPTVQVNASVADISVGASVTP